MTFKAAPSAPSWPARGIGLTKSGSGTATLNNADTYSGVTTINQGTLALGASGSFANSPTINVASTAVLDLTAKTSSFNFGAGQTLKGFGTVNIGSGKTVSLAGGGTFAPGGSIGTLSVTGNLDLTGGTAAIELGTPGASHAAAGTSDSSAVTGNLTLGGTLNLIDNAGANGQGSAGVGSYKIFTYTGTESGLVRLRSPAGASVPNISRPSMSQPTRRSISTLTITP